MSEPEQEAPAQTEVPEGVDPTTGEVLEPDDGDEQEDTPLEDDEPDELDAELSATIEREHELAAERQEEAASLEAQQREQDAKNKKLVQLAGHVAKRYHDILGADLDGFVGCPLCAPWFPGIRLPVMPDYDTVSAVKIAIGEDPDPPLLDDPYSRQCEACGGRGVVKTNSYVSGETKAKCIPCDGHGWVAVGPERDRVGITGTMLPPVVPINGGLVPTGDEPPEAAALKALGYIVVPPVNTPESIAAQSGQ